MRSIKYPNVIELVEYDSDGNKCITKYYREDIIDRVKWAIEGALKRGIENEDD